MYKMVKLFDEPIDIFEKLGERQSELSDLNLSFICGLIKEYRPRNIVEVGVSAGGTSCVILNCLDKLNLNSRVTSVDLAYTFHKNIAKECGYQIKDAEKYLRSIQNHKLYLGKRIVDVLDDIVNENGKIDMLILDTIHFLPGELLDFLVCFPFLSENAIVILDDLVWAHESESSRGIATRVLFDSVVADKFIPTDYEEANMGAFRINGETKKYISNCFSALLTPWYYQMKEEVEAYRKLISQCYDEEMVKLFNGAVAKNNETVERKLNIPNVIKELFQVAQNGKENYIYGAGKRGAALAAFFEDRGVNINGFIISDDREKCDFKNLSKNIYHLTEISNHEDINIIVAVANRDVISNLEKCNYKYVEPKNDIFVFIKEYSEYLLNY